MLKMIIINFNAFHPPTNLQIFLHRNWIFLKHLFIVQTFSSSLVELSNSKANKNLQLSLKSYQQDSHLGCGIVVEKPNGPNSEERILACEISNPLGSQENVTFSIKLNPKALPANQETIEFKAHVNRLQLYLHSNQKLFSFTIRTLKAIFRVL